MRVVIEVWNGCIQEIVADEECEVLIIERDELAEAVLPDGERGYISGRDVASDARAVNELYSFAGWS